MIEVNARRATREVACLFYALFTARFYPQGWMPALHGSTVGAGEGRDIDIILVPIKPNAQITEVIRLLEEAGMDIRLVEERGQLRGLVGVMQDYVVDVTVVL